MNEHELQAYDLAKMILEFEPGQHDEERGLFYRETAIDGAMHHAEAIVSKWPTADKIDLARVRATIEAQHNVALEDHGSLAGDASKAWVTEDAKANWVYWKRYQKLLSRMRPPATIRDMDALTDQIMNVVGNPRDGGKWQRKGLVYGDIQSGKTSTLIGLGCKAADSGVKFVVILTGMEEDLRVQTQARVDEGIVGIHRIKTGPGRYQVTSAGVGERGVAFANSLTSLDNDFSQKAGTGLSLAATTAVTLLVIKKNSSVLLNVIEWLCGQYHLDPRNPGSIDEAILVIDDECDWGSVDTGKRDFNRSREEHEATKINQRIRSLLKLFDRSIYAGFTGTPFANLLTDAGLTNKRYGDDLFPKDFLVNLGSPANYLGVARFFGNGDRDMDTDEAANNQGLRELMKTIPSSEAEWLPSSHKKGHAVHGPLPASLQEAIQRFLVATAIRHGQHNSMLVNLTRFQDVQKKLRVEIENYVAALGNALAMEDATTIAAMRRLYEGDIVPNCHSLWKREPAEGKAAVELPEWSVIEGRLLDVVGKVTTKAINGKSSDVLQYMKGEATYVIAVGGQKLSRGLTLEGLTVSYFVRTMNQADTALQMGRWFGYRDGFLGLCRLYATQEAFEKLANMAELTTTLRADIASYDVNTRPEDMCLSFINSPGTKITARNKQQNAVVMTTSMAGKMPETKIFDPSPEIRIRNRQAVETLIGAIGRPKPPLRHHGKQELDADYEHVKLWRDVSCGLIMEFFDNYVTHEAAEVARSNRLRAFIAKQVGEGNQSFERMSVAFMAAKPGPIEHTIAGFAYTPRLRSPDAAYVDAEREKLHYLDEAGRYVIKRIATGTNELVDATPELLAHATMLETAALRGKALPVKQNKVPDWPYLRAARQHLNLPGLLLIYPIVPHLIEAKHGWTPRDEPYFGFAAIFPGEKTKDGRIMTRQSKQKILGETNE